MPREPVHGHCGPSRELFIYYRITSSAAAAAREIVDVYQARLQARHPGLTARLLHRPDEQLGRQTWMETYKHAAAGGVDDALAAEIEREAQALAPHIDGSRHIEVFVSCAS